MSALSKLFNVTVTVTVANKRNSNIFFNNYVQGVGDVYELVHCIEWCVLGLYIVQSK